MIVVCMIAIINMVLLLTNIIIAVILMVNHNENQIKQKMMLIDIKSEIDLLKMKRK